MEYIKAPNGLVGVKFEGIVKVHYNRDMTLLE